MSENEPKPRRARMVFALGASCFLGSGCASVAEQRAAYGRSVDVEVALGESSRPFELALLANERLLAIDPDQVLADALARCPDADAETVRLLLDPGLVRPSSLRTGSFSALAPGAPPGGEAPELPDGIDVAGRLRLQAVVEHGRGRPRVSAQAVADFALAGPARRWEPLLRAIAEVAAERARDEVLSAARAQHVEARACE
jgi:hypothetical protein